MDDEDISLVEEPTKAYNIRHRAYAFAKDTLQVIGAVSYDKVYTSIFEQLVRSATSIGANLVEGTAGASKKDFLKFLIIALKSTNETKYWLCLIRDTINNIEKEKIKELIKEADEISKMGAAIIISTKATT